MQSMLQQKYRNKNMPDCSRAASTLLFQKKGMFTICTCKSTSPYLAFYFPVCCLPEWEFILCFVTIKCNSSFFCSRSAPTLTLSKRCTLCFRLWHTKCAKINTVIHPKMYQWGSNKQRHYKELQTGNWT